MSWCGRLWLRFVPLLLSALLRTATAGIWWGPGAVEGPWRDIKVQGKPMLDSAGWTAGATDTQPSLERQPPALDGVKLDHLIVVPEHNLLFCYIDKVNSRAFNEIFRAVRSSYDPGQALGPLWFRNTYWQHNYSKEELRHLFVNSSWHKAVFFRDPLERFIAAFETQCGSNESSHLSRCTAMFGTSPLSLSEAIKRFHGNVDEALSSDRWGSGQLMRQIQFCGGLGDTLSFYDTVVRLDPSTVHGDVEELLTVVGVPSERAKAFVHDAFPKQLDSGAQTSSPLPYDLDQRLPHYFGTAESQPWMVRALLRHYKRDYVKLNLSVPGWAREVLNRGSKRMPRWAGRTTPRAGQAEFLGAGSQQLVSHVVEDDEIDMDGEEW